VTKPQLAPFAARRQSTGGGGSSGSNSVRTASTGTGRSSRGNGNYGGGSDSGPPIPEAGTPGGLPPAHFGTEEPSTYTIPIYVDGQKVRTDTVLKPKESRRNSY
jgi:hypothetical protein